MRLQKPTIVSKVSIPSSPWKWAILVGKNRFKQGEKKWSGLLAQNIDLYKSFRYRNGTRTEPVRVTWFHSPTCVEITITSLFKNRYLNIVYLSQFTTIKFPFKMSTILSYCFEKLIWQAHKFVYIEIKALIFFTFINIITIINISVTGWFVKYVLDKLSQSVINRNVSN